MSGRHQQPVPMDGDNSSDAGPNEDEEEEYAWVSYFCSLKGNEFFCQVLLDPFLGFAFSHAPLYFLGCGRISS